jgi:hypothetical protein
MARDRAIARRGPKRGGGESTGHASGRRTVAILRSKGANFGDDEYLHMRQLVGYAKRHLKQRPRGDVSDTAWRYSLMNWGTTRLGRNSINPTAPVGSTRTRGRSR